VRSRLGGPALALLLAACATKPPPARRYEPPHPPVSSATKPAARPPERVEPTNFDALPGWREEDHTAALAAFAATCNPDEHASLPPLYGEDRDVAKRSPGLAGADYLPRSGLIETSPPRSSLPSRPSPPPGGEEGISPLAVVCREARDAGLLAPDEARRFLETHFRPELIEGGGLLTAYFMPVYQARTQPDGEFSAPVRPRPADLPRHPRPGDYADRAAIAARPATDAVAWMRAEDLFFLQIQGSGVLVFPDGARARTVFDGTNGADFVGIAAPMRREGLLADRQTSASGIRGWLADHRGLQADAVMNQDPRYVFFRLGPDDGGEPPGAAGRPLVAGRSLAVDPNRHAMGEVFWIDASAPALAGAFATYRRLAIALDTGGAIRGDVRADLYMGRGDAAGLEAGRVRHTLRLYRLIPTP
jgi:membrane-bound lytic murein transglycosylase A